MFCPKCGSENPDGSKFCKACGAPLRQQTTPAPYDNLAPHTLGSQAGFRQPGQPALAPKPRHSKKPLVIGIVAVAVALAVAAFVLLHVVGVSSGGGSSSKGAVATSDGTNVGGVTVGGTEMGNTGSNYAMAAPSVSASDYDYFYSYERRGICRAKDDGSSMDVIVPFASTSDTASWLNLDGDTLFYLKTENSGGTSYTVHSAKTDGSGDSIIYTLSAAGSSGSSIQGVYLYDHVLYVLDESYDSSSHRSTFDLWTMGEDGSNQQKVGGYQTDGTTGPFVTKDKIYFTYTASYSSNNPMGEVYSQNLDGSDFTKIYTSTVGSIYGMPIVQDGKIYFAESNSSMKRSVITQTALDGSNASELYQADAYSLYLRAVADGKVYVVSYGDYGDSSQRLTSVPLDGGDTSVIAVQDNAYNPFVCTADDHLLVTDGGDGGAAGLTVYTMDYDGNKLHDYVVSSS